MLDTTVTGAMSCSYRQIHCPGACNDGHYARAEMVCILFTDASGVVQASQPLQSRPYGVDRFTKRLRAVPHRRTPRPPDTRMTALLRSAQLCAAPRASSVTHSLRRVKRRRCTMACATRCSRR